MSDRGYSPRSCVGIWPIRRQCLGIYRSANVIDGAINDLKTQEIAAIPRSSNSVMLHQQPICY